jgi:hypothetical protein
MYEFDCVPNNTYQRATDFSYITAQTIGVRVLHEALFVDLHRENSLELIPLQRPRGTDNPAEYFSSLVPSTLIFSSKALNNRIVPTNRLVSTHTK